MHNAVGLSSATACSPTAQAQQHLRSKDGNGKAHVGIPISNYLFRDTYHYDIEEWKIPTQGSHLALNRRIMTFVKPAAND